MLCVLSNNLLVFYSSRGTPCIIRTSHSTLKTPFRHTQDTLQTPSRQPLDTHQTPSRQPLDTLQTISMHLPHTHKTVTKFHTCRVIPTARSQVRVILLLLLPSFFHCQNPNTTKTQLNLNLT